MTCSWAGSPVPGVDDTDWAHRLAALRPDAKSGVEHLEQLPFDRGFTLALSHWRQLLERLELLRADIGLHVVLVAHAKADRATIEKAGGSAWLIERHAPALLHRQASALIQDWCDEVLFAAPAAPLDLAANASGVTGDGRILRTVPSTIHAAKNRLHLPPRLPPQPLSLTRYLATDQSFESVATPKPPQTTTTSSKGKFNLN